MVGRRQGKAHIVQRVTSGVTTQVIEIAFVHGDPSALGDGVVDIAITGGFGNLDAYAAPEGGAVDVLGKERQHHLTAVSAVGDKIDIVQGRGAVELVFLVGLHRGIVGGAGRVAVVELAAVAVGQGKGDAGQVAAGTVPAETVKVIGIELQRLVGGNGVDDVLHLGHGDLNGALEEGGTIGIAGVGNDRCAAEIRLGNEGHVAETPLGQGGVDIVHFARTDARASIRLRLIAVVQSTLFGGEIEAAHMAEGPPQHIAALILDTAHQAREGHRLTGIHGHRDGISDIAFHFHLAGRGIGTAADLGGNGGGTLFDTIKVSVIDLNHRRVAAAPLNSLLLQRGTKHLIL